jgi:NAD dependent epimerase/dehydratase
MAAEKVFITGASGFIGSHVVEQFVKFGFDVTALVHYNSRADQGWLVDLDKEIRSSLNVKFGDITDSEQMQNFIAGKNLVVNLAALIAIPYSYLAPRSYLNTNVIGTMNICEAVRTNHSRLIHFSTSEVYGTPKTVPITENHNLNPQSPYAASKSAADQICISYHKSFEMDVTVLRPFNTYGPRQSMRAIIPTIINQFIARDGEINIGNLAPKRDFTFVEDTAAAVTSIANSEGLSGETIQLGTGDTYSIQEVIELCEKISGKKALLKHDTKRMRPIKSEVEILLSDPSRAKGMLRWEPLVSFEEGLKKTYAWFEKNQSKYENIESYIT